MSQSGFSDAQLPCPFVPFESEPRSPAEAQFVASRVQSRSSCGVSRSAGHLSAAPLKTELTLEGVGVQVVQRQWIPGKFSVANGKPLVVALFCPKKIGPIPPISCTCNISRSALFLPQRSDFCPQSSQDLKFSGKKKAAALPSGNPDFQGVISSAHAKFEV